MDTLTGKIEKYWAHLQAGPIKKKDMKPRAIIRCYNDVGLVLEANFYSGKKNIPENYYSINSKLVYLRYPMSMYGHVIDLLRNEKPIYFRYNELSKIGFIRTDKEPVGEGEIEHATLEGVV